MKYLLLLISLVTIHRASAQKPERVFGWARIQYPLPWYKEQSAAWKKVIDANPTNGMAWYNYYYANRILGFHDTSFKQRKEFMNQLVAEMDKKLPECYESLLIKFSIHAHEPEYQSNLEKIIALGQGRTEHLDWIINRGELSRNISERDQASMSKFNAGEISTGMMYYNYNVLSGLENNAVLLTTGDNDTYPAWVLQARGIRRDVAVLNLSLLQLDDYRNKVFQELGIEKYELIWGSTQESKRACTEKFYEEIVNHISKNKKNFPVYVALTAMGCDGISEKIAENLYLTGLAYRYSPEAMDNIAVLKLNFEKKYKLDYIQNGFYTDISEAMVKMINTNYVVPMLKLYDHYEASGDIQKQAEIKSQILYISKGTDDEEEVKKHFEKK